MHSRPGYYGTYLAIWTVLPALVVTLVWAAAEPAVIRHLVGETLPQSVRSLSPAEQSLTIGRISSVAKGLPSLSREDYEVIKRVRFGFAAPDDALRILQDRGVALGSAPEPFVITAAYDQVEYERWSRLLNTGRRRRARAPRPAVRACAHPPAASRPQHGRTGGARRARAVIDGRDPDHRRHHPVDAVRDHPLLLLRLAARLFPRHRLGPPLLRRGQLGRRRGAVRASAAAVGHALHLHRRAAGRGARRALQRDLHVGVRQPPRAHGGKAAPRRFSPASQPSSTACSRSSPSGRSCAMPAPQSGSTSRQRAC